MGKRLRHLLTSAVLIVGASLGTAVGHAGPMEKAWIGPYSSFEACEQDRAQWPVWSEPCVQRDDGIYFYGLRQARQ